MTILPRQELERRLLSAPAKERLFVSPMLDFKRQLGPASIDLRLGTDFLLPRQGATAGLDPGEAGDPTALESVQERVVCPLGEGLWLHPQRMVLGSTLEFIRLPADCGAYVLGRSSWGRIGLLVATAVYVQPGYAGSLTLELVNEADTPIKLWPGLRVAQLVVHKLSEATDAPYDEKYVRAIGPEPAKLGWDSDEVAKLKAIGATLAHGDAHRSPESTSSEDVPPSASGAG
jgi:dCTP deaminase